MSRSRDTKMILRLHELRVAGCARAARADDHGAREFPLNPEMGPTAALYQALRTFDRPATRAEIEREAGLEKPAADGALRVLARAGALVSLVDAPRYRGLYKLAAGAACPPGRGKYSRR